MYINASVCLQYRNSWPQTGQGLVIGHAAGGWPALNQLRLEFSCCRQRAGRSCARRHRGAPGLRPRQCTGKRPVRLSGSLSLASLAHLGAVTRVMHNLCYILANTSFGAPDRHIPASENNLTPHTHVTCIPHWTACGWPRDVLDSIFMYLVICLRKKNSISARAGHYLIKDGTTIEAVTNPSPRLPT